METLANSNTSLSLQQQHIKLLGRKEIYLHQCIIEIGGFVNESAVKNALGQILDEHPLLRSIYSADIVNGIETILVQNAAALNFQYIDQTPHNGTAPSQSMQELLENDRKELHEKQDLFKTTLIRTGRQSFSLLISLSALLGDAETLKIIFKLLFRHMRTVALPAEDEQVESIRYSDYIEWQRNVLQDKEDEAYLFWKNYKYQEYLHHHYPFEPLEPLPYQPFQRYGVKRRTLSPAESEAIAQLAGSTASEEDIIFQAFSVLLARHWQADDFVVGRAFHARDQQELLTSVGPFSKILPLTMHVDWSASCGRQLKEIQSTWQEITTFHDSFFWENGLSIKPDIPAVFEYIELPPRLAGEDLFMEMTGLYNLPDSCMLRLSCVKANGNLQVLWYYDRAYLDEFYVQLLDDQLKECLQLQKIHAGCLLKNVDILSEAEKNLILEQFNHPVDPASQDTVIGLFNRTAALYPDNIAVSCLDRTITYAKLNEKACAIAACIQTQLNVKAGSVAGILMERSEDCIAVMLGILKAGCSFLPIAAEWPVKRMQYVLENANAKVLLYDMHLLSERPDCNIIMLPTDVLLAGISAENSQDTTEIAAGRDAYIIYTSGSTGQPKGVVINQGSFLNYVRWANKYYFDDQAGYSFACFTPLTFDLTITSIFTTLLRGDAICILSENQEMNELLKQAFDPAANIQAVKLTPSQVTLMSFAGITSTSVRVVILGGEALTNEQVAYLQSLNASMRIFNEYGPTETTVGCTVKEITKATSINIGRPVANARIYILDDQERLLPIGIPGQLAIGGSVLARGYANNAELTAKQFVPDPFAGSDAPSPARMYLTGDVARWLPDGELSYLGRSDTQVKLRGYRIELSEVENVVKRFDTISNAVVALSDDNRNNQRLICFYSGNTYGDEHDLIQFVQQYLPAYMLPSQWVYITRWPLSANGKIDKKQLVEYASSAGQIEHTAPSTVSQQALLEIWMNVLGRKDIDVRQNFFNIGGNSLNAIQVMTEVHKKFNVEISLQDIFSSNTPEKLSGLIDKAVSANNYADIPAISLQPYYEVSRGQKRMWILQQADPLSVAYNVPYAVEIKGALDISLWSQSLKQLIGRHEILRTSFFEMNGEVKQVVHAPEEINFDLVLTDLQGNPEQDTLVAEAVNLEAAMPFDLGQAPLVRGSILKCDGRTIFLISMHHIITDGVSLTNMMAEVIGIYDALLNSTTPVLPSLPVQYKDFAAWQNEQLLSEDYKVHRSFWIEQLHDAPRLEMHADKPRPPIKTYAGGMEGCIIPADIANAFHALSKKEEATVFMSLLALVNVLIARYCGQGDITIGTPVAGRLHADLNHQLGFYVNTLPLRNRFPLTCSFRELLQQIKTNMFNALSHQVYPFDDIIADLGMPSDLSRSPLFDIMLEYDNSDGLNSVIRSLPGVSFQLLQSDIITSKFDLSFAVNEDEDGMFLSIEYNKDIFSKERISNMLAHVQTLMRNIANDPSQPLHEYELISVDERQHLLSKVNETDTVFEEADFIARFEALVADYPDRTAIRFGENSYTYEELNGRANQFAHYLVKKYNIESDDLVGVLMQRSEEMIVAILGILKAGAAYLPIDVSMPAARLKLILRDAGPSVVLTDFPPSVHFPNILQLERVLREIDKYSPENVQLKRDPASMAYMIYTSGTTGNPKGVMIQWGSLCNYINAFNAYFRLTPNDQMIQGASVSFDISIDELFPILAAGGTMYISAQGIYDVEEFIREIHEQNITVVSTTPHVVDLINKSIPAATSLRTVISGGDTLEPRYADQLVNRGLKVYNTYGPTEATVCATYYQVQPEDLSRALIPIGTPIANAKVYILDEYMQPVPAGLTGELYIGGTGVAKGYWEQDELTAQKFIQNPLKAGERIYKTGDTGRWNWEGNIELIGRNDEQVKIRGYRIELRDVEHTMARYTNVENVKAIAGTHNNSRYLAAYVISSGEMDLVEFRTYIQNYLPAYMVPDFIMMVKEFPLTANGKLDVKKLPSPMLEGTGIEKNFIPPQNAIQEKLVEIWKRVLSLSSLSINDNFFFVGGHSLKAVLLVKTIYEEMGHKLLLRDIFNYPTVRELSTLFGSTTESGLLLNLNNVKVAGSNLYMIPPIIGSSTLFKDLANALEGTVNCYGVQYKGFDEEVEFDESIDAMADTFVKEIIRVQPAGPYMLLGYSMGGVVAFEMARKLEKAGHGEVDVILVDSAPETEAGKSQQEVSYDETHMNMELHEWLNMLNMEEKIRISQLYRHNHNLLFRHITKDVIKGNIYTFLSDTDYAEQKVREWEYYTLGDFTYTRVKGNHFNILALNRDLLAENISTVIMQKRNNNID